MTTSVLLIRHAAHGELGRLLTGRKPGVPLSDLGERQARALADRIGCTGLTEIHTSPRTRARATAATIARRAGCAVTIAAALDEIDFGDWTGTSFQELAGQALWQRWNEARGSACPPNGETMAAAVARMTAYLETVAAAAGDGATVACVTHCDMIRATVAHYLGLPLDHLLRFDIDCASVSRLRIGSEGVQLASLNEGHGP